MSESYVTLRAEALRLMLVECREKHGSELSQSDVIAIDGLLEAIAERREIEIIYGEKE